MATLEAMAASGHEQVLYWHDPAAGLRAIIAVHSTVLGPALGGCRMHPYAGEDDALADVLRLSRGMTYKAAVAGVHLGGGKSVILGDPAVDKTDALLRSFGRFVDTIGGCYTASEDVGTSMDDLAVMRTQSRHISNDFRGPDGDMNYLTALGTFEGIRAALDFATGSPDPRGRLVAVQGLGHVGLPLCELLTEAGAGLIVTDVRADQVRAAVDKFDARAVAPAEIITQECDVFAPCAMGGIIDDAAVESLRCQVVAGTANNVLATAAHGERLHERGIVLAPDYVVNGGGLIAEAAQLAGETFDDARRTVLTVFDNVANVLAVAAHDGIAPTAAADRIAEQRLAQGAARAER